MKRIEEINRIDSKFKTEKSTLGYLLEEIETKQLSTKYFLQRLEGNWTNEEINKYICRILNGMPVPEIIICEVIRESTGIKKRFLIDGLQRLSYALNFKNNLLKIGKKGAELNVISYIDKIKDENGNILTDEDSDPLVEVKEIDVVGKTYSELPKFLQDRFDKYNVSVTTFFDCSDDEVSYHIRNYNSHVGMNTAQKAKTHASETVARWLNKLEQHHFFTDCTKYSNKNLIKGAIARCVADVVFWENFPNDFHRLYDRNLEYLSENATDEMFETLQTELDELEDIVSEVGMYDMFDTGKTFLYLITYNTFKKLNMESEKFGEYLEYLNSLENFEEITVNGDSFELIGSGKTKNHNTITRKLAIYEGLMKEFFGIASEKETVEEPVEEETTVENNTVDDDEFDDDWGDLDDSETTENTGIIEEESVEVDDTLEDLIFGDDNTEKTYTVPTFGEQKFIKDFNDAINFFGTTSNEQTEMAIRSYLMCVKDQRELDEFDIQCDLNDDKHKLSEYEDVCLYTGMLADYAMRRDIEYSDMYTDCKNVPALVKLVKYACDNDIDDEYTEKWFGRYAQLYDNRVDEYFNKDVYTRYEMFKEDFDNYYALCNRRAS